MHPKSGNNKEVFVDLINDFDNILNMLKALNTKAIQWFECWRDNNEFDATVVAESMIDDFKEHLDFYRLYHLLTEFHGKIEDAVFILESSNNAFLADKLSGYFFEACEITMTLQDRSEYLLESNPFQNETIDPEDEVFWIYDHNINVKEQASVFSYITKIDGITRAISDLLRRISDGRLKMKEPIESKFSSIADLKTDTNPIVEPQIIAIDRSHLKRLETQKKRGGWNTLLDLINCHDQTRGIQYKPSTHGKKQPDNLQGVLKRNGYEEAAGAIYKDRKTKKICIKEGFAIKFSEK